MLPLTYQNSVQTRASQPICRPLKSVTMEVRLSQANSTSFFSLAYSCLSVVYSMTCCVSLMSYAKSILSAWPASYFLHSWVSYECDHGAEGGPWAKRQLGMCWIGRPFSEELHRLYISQQQPWTLAFPVMCPGYLALVTNSWEKKHLSAHVHVYSHDMIVDSTFW